MKNFIKRIIEEPDRVFKLLSKEIPYKNHTAEWNVLIDLHTSAGNNVASDDLVSLGRMILEHDQSIEYYEKRLPKLIADGIIIEVL